MTMPDDAIAQGLASDAAADLCALWDCTGDGRYAIPLGADAAWDYSGIGTASIVMADGLIRPPLPIPQLSADS